MLYFLGNHYQPIKIINEGQNELKLLTFNQISDQLIIKARNDLNEINYPNFEEFLNHIYKQNTPHSIGGSAIQNSMELEDSLQPIIFTNDIYEFKDT